MIRRAITGGQSREPTLIANLVTARLGARSGQLRAGPLYALLPLAAMPRAAQVAQLVEHVTENHGVGGSIPPLGTNINPTLWYTFSF